MEETGRGMIPGVIFMEASEGRHIRPQLTLEFFFFATWRTDLGETIDVNDISRGRLLSG